MWSWILAVALASAAPEGGEASEQELIAAYDQAFLDRDFAGAIVTAGELVPLIAADPGRPLHLADALARLGHAQRAAGAHDEAVASYSRAIEAAAPVAEETEPQFANLHRFRARALADDGRYDEAAAAHERVIEMFRAGISVGLDNTLELGYSLNDLGMVERLRGNMDVAESLFDDTLSLLRARLPADHVEIASPLNNLAGLRKAQGRYPEARTLYERALGVYLISHGENHPDTAAAFNNLASLEYDVGNYDKAESFFEKSVEIQELLFGPDHPKVATGLANLAVCLQFTGRHRAARAMLERSLAIRTATLGPDHIMVANTVHNLAGVLVTLGDFATARPMYDRSLERRQAVLGRDHTLVANSLNDLAGLLMNQGDSATALPMYEESLRIRLALHGEMHPEVASSLNSLASSLEEVGEDERARELFERAIRIREEILGPDHVLVALSYGSVASLHMKLGDPDAAEARYIRSRAILADAFGTRHRFYGTSTGNLGVHYKQRGRFDEAKPLLELALQINREALGEDHVRVAANLNNLANLHRDMGDRQRAISLLEEAVAIMDRHLDLLDHLSEREAMEWLAALRHHVDAWLSLADAPEHNSSSWLWALRVKGAIGARHRAARFPSNPESAAIAADLAGVRQSLAQVAFAAYEPEGETERRAQLSELSARKEVLERDLMERSAGFRQARRIDEADPQAVCAAVPPGAVLIDLHRYKFDKKPRYLAFSVRHEDCEVRRVDLGPAGPIDEAIASWRSVLDDPDALDTRVDDRGSVVADRVWAPIASIVGSAERLIIVPDGPLSSIPFAALPVDGQYLVETRAIRYLDRANDLLLPRPEVPARGALVVGGIDYDATPSNVRTESHSALAPCVEGGFEPLPGASREAASVAGRWSRIRRGEPLVTLGGAEATESAVATEIKGKAVAHIATHGFFATERCRSAVEGEGRGFNPMLLSGLVLAGANQPADPLAHTDGILTAEEVASLDLRGTGLVVLSACETGLGEIRSGEGVLGLRRAFAISGTQSLIMSLWSVSDDRTSELMNDLYKHHLRRRSVGASDSLRAAQLAMLARNRRESGSARPHDWAAFVAAGR